MTASTQKTCTQCNETHDIEMFGLKNKATGQRHSACKTCKRAYAKQHYNDNKGAYLEKAARHNEEYRDRNRQVAEEFLATKSCSACEGTEDLVAYTGGPDAGVQPVWCAIGGGVSVASLRASLESSTILCRCCLGKHSHENLAFWTNLTHAQRVELQQQRLAEGHQAKPVGYFRSYVRRDEAPKDRLERLSTPRERSMPAAHRDEHRPT